MTGKQPIDQDQEIVKEIKRSDGDAFQILFDRYYNKLYRFFWYRIRSSDLSKDMVQETFVRLWEHRKDLRDDSPIQPFLYRIANNLFIDYLRKKSLEISFMTEKISETDQFKPHESIDLHDAIDTFLNSLPHEQKHVFILNRYEGFKYSEIAEILGISIKTVESRISSVLKSMRENLDQYL